MAFDYEQHLGIYKQHPGIFEQHPGIAERFADLHPPLGAQAAVIEANRCLNCFDAPCTGACPTHIDVPRFIKKIASGNLNGSARTILEANVLGASCSRVCPVEVLCEGACVMHRQNEKPIEIGRLQRRAMDFFLAEFEAGRASLRKKTDVARVEQIACVGAGPASLACAAELAMQGFQVTVFDKRPLPGGLNTYGVAEYKLPAAASLREMELVRSLGVRFEFGAELGAKEFAEVETQFDAVFIGVGLGAMRRLDVPGGDHAGVVDALRFIAGYKAGGRNEVGRSVVVVGAGNTAIDAAVAAKRLGAEQVHLVHRRGESEISAFDFEYAHAKDEGVRFIWNARLVAVHAHDDSARDGGACSVITSIECERVDAAGAHVSQSANGATFHLECDMVIPAIGQSPLGEMLAEFGVEMEHGRVVAERATGRTSNPKVYAGGDCMNGGREVVDAVADGKRAGAAIAAALSKRAVAHG